jgi:hypothetical protein
MFEPIHRSVPEFAGKQTFNPIDTILEAKMMLEWLGGREATSFLQSLPETVGFPETQGSSRGLFSRVGEGFCHLITGKDITIFSTGLGS